MRERGMIMCICMRVRSMYVVRYIIIIVFFNLAETPHRSLLITQHLFFVKQMAVFCRRENGIHHIMEAPIIYLVVGYLVSFGDPR